MSCDASASGSVASGLMWWPEPGRTRRLDRTSISHLKMTQRVNYKRIYTTCGNNNMKKKTVLVGTFSANHQKYGSQCEAVRSY